MIFAREDLDILYADFGVEVCRANGAPSFMAIKGVTDEGVFDTATISEHRIRYPHPGTVCLNDGEELVIASRAYKVPRTAPRRINDGNEATVELIPL